MKLSYTETEYFFNPDSCDITITVDVTHPGGDICRGVILSQDAFPDEDEKTEIEKEIREKIETFLSRLKNSG